MGELTDNIASVLAELLEVAAVNPDAGFLDLGGTSVLAIRASARIATQHRVKIQPSEFLRNQSARDIARLIYAASASRSPATTTVRL